jgi:hypothetical protein
MERQFWAVLAAAVALTASVTIGQASTTAGDENQFPLDPGAVSVTLPPVLPDQQPFFPTPVGAANFAQTAAFSSTASYLVSSTRTLTTTGPAAEEQIAVDPTDDRRLVAAITDYARGDAATKYVYSVDHGTTWKEKFIPMNNNGSPLTRDGSWQVAGDPMLAVDKQHRVYLSEIYFNRINSASGVYVSVSNFDPSSGVSFTTSNTFPVATNLSSTSTRSEDKPWITTDNSTSPFNGRVYVTWTRYVSNPSSNVILFSRSTNGGRNWSAPIQVSAPSHNNAVQGSQVAVGPGGEIYVVYEVFLAGGLRQQFLTKSIDGGASFSMPLAITPRFNELTFPSIYRKNSFASLAVSPLDGSVYVAYADQPNSTVGAEVELVASRDGGATYTAPTVMNDTSAGQQFFPAIAVDRRGVLHASWFDTRKSPSDSTFYEVYSARSADGGLTFGRNSRVTGNAVRAGSFIGDYAGIAVTNDITFPVWTSGGSNGGRLQTARLRLP